MWIWITGASSGLGESLCYAYDSLNAHIILSSRNREKLQVVKDACTGQGEKHIVPLDLEKYKELDAVVEKVFKITDYIDILINNGGISQRGNALETDISVTERLMDVNFLGTVALTQAVLPAMIKRGHGQVVVISSIVGKFGSPYRTSYSAAKHALVGYFDSLRFELEDKGIDISIICPGFIHTDVSRNALTEDGTPQDTMDEKTRNGLSPEAFAQMAVKAIHKKKKEVYIGKSEILVVYLKRYFPSLFRTIIRRVNVR